MSSVPKKFLRQKTRARSSAYSLEERAIIDANKELYKQQPTRALRAEVFRKILSHIYNYWQLKNLLPHDEEEIRRSIQVLAS